MLCCAGHLAPLLLFALLSVSSLLLVDGSHQDQEFGEAVGSRFPQLYYHKAITSSKHSRSKMRTQTPGQRPPRIVRILILLQTYPDAHEVHCSRQRSRAAWQAIDEYLMPFVEKEKYELPSKCRLRPDNDMFREQEQHKIHFDINEWHCGFCKKAFRAEKFLDQHFENRHKNLVDNSEGRCMADLCGALHCDLMMQFKKPKSKCNAAAATRNRHLCESLADSCFPVNQGLAASRLHEFFLRQFCDAHTCNKGTKPFPKGGRKQTNRFYLALCILTLILLPLFYLIVFLHQREMRKGTQDLKRFSKIGQKKKPF